MTTIADRPITSGIERCETRSVAIFAIKTVHSIAFWIIQTCIVYLVYKGLRRQSDHKAAVAATVAIGESAVYAANGFRCPLTDLAERLGSEHGAVTDIFLPRWLANNIARIYTPLLLWAIVLHVGNLRRRGGIALRTSKGGSACTSESSSL